MPFSGVIPAAEVVRAPFGLSSESATLIVHGDSDTHWISGYEQEYSLCDVIVKGWDLCASAPATTFHDSTAADRYGKVQPFAVVIRDGCDSPLGTALRDEREKRLLDLLYIASLKAAERELWSGPVTIASEGVPANRNKYLKNGSATSVGASVAAPVALAQLEDAYAACGNGERATIHMTSGTAALLAPHLYRVNDNHITTFAGSNVIVGSGYTAESATTALMFATGPVIVQLGQSSMLSENQADYFDPAANKFVLQAERAAAVTWDGCCHFSATVNYAA